MGSSVPRGRLRPAIQVGGAALLAALLVAPIVGPAPSVGAQSRAVEKPNDSSLIVINDGSEASPYPATITLENVPGTIIDIKLRLLGLTHTSPDDLDIMLVSPDGQAVLVMSDAGGSGVSNNVSGLDLTFDTTSQTPLPDETPIQPARYEATDYDTTGGDSDAFGATAPSPNSDSMADFLGGDPNGDWRLFVRDDDTNNDVGRLTNGWSLRVETTNSGPTAVTDRYETREDKQLRVLRPTDGLLANDTDPDNDRLKVRFPQGETGVAYTRPTKKGGTVKIYTNGAFVYTPKANFSGQDSFRYTVVDPDGQRDRGKAVITVDAQPD